MVFVLQVKKMSNKNIQQIVYINLLIDYYGQLLTDAQFHIIEQYYRYNLSMNEIAEERQISRSAVNFSLKKSIATLNGYENTLNLIKKQKHLDKLLDELVKENDENKRRNIVEIYKKGKLL